VNGEERQYGFGLNDATYYKINPPGNDGATSQAFGITGSDVVIGDSLDFGSFSLYRDTYRQITIPNDPSAQVLGVDPSGLAVVGVSQGGQVGFLYTKKRLVPLEFPGADSTYPFGVNSSGEVTGYFEDKNAGYHGFTWNPPSQPAKE
jgi:hypothetical protein